MRILHIGAAMTFVMLLAGFAQAQSADLSVTKTDSPDPVIAGNNLTYTITVTNAGPMDAVNASMTEATPANTTFVSFTAPAGWSVTTPAVGGTGTINATNATVLAGSTHVFTMVVNVNASTPNGSTLTNTADVTSTTTDPNAADNTDTETSAVGFGVPALPTLALAAFALLLTMLAVWRLLRRDTPPKTS